MRSTIDKLESVLNFNNESTSENNEILTNYKKIGHYYLGSYKFDLAL